MKCDLESPTNDDLKKNISCTCGLKIVLLIASALLAGMIITTVVIFATGLRVKKAEEVQQVPAHHKKPHLPGHPHHQQTQEVLRGTNAPTDEDGADKPKTKLGESTLSLSNSTQPCPVQPTASRYAFLRPMSWYQLTKECGESIISASRIVNGGVVTNATRYPWAAYMSESRDTNDPAKDFFCGAQLISHQWAVTAAHCVSHFRPKLVNPDITLAFGHLDQSSSVPCNATVVSVDKVIIHEAYDADTTNNDIALLKLSRRLSFSDTLRPVCINSNSQEYTTFQDADCHVVGWGTTSYGGPSSGTLQEVESPLVANAAECRNAYGSAITDQMICAKTNHKSIGSGSCQGDSGGPMTCRDPRRRLRPDKNAFFLVGITSFGHGCGYPDFPDVMTRVSQFYTWIRSKIPDHEV